MSTKSYKEKKKRRKRVKVLKLFLIYSNFYNFFLFKRDFTHKNTVLQVFKQFFLRGINYLTSLFILTSS